MNKTLKISIEKQIRYYFFFYGAGKPLSIKFFMRQ